MNWLALFIPEDVVAHVPNLIQSGPFSEVATNTFPPVCDEPIQCHLT